MNQEITSNLFEFWSYIGKENNSYIDSLNFKAVSVAGSDWPKRIYSIEDKSETFDEAIQLSQQNLLPEIITLEKNNGLINNYKTHLLFKQANMSLALKDCTNEIEKSPSIYQVETKVEAFDFSNIASESFGYRVDGNIVYNICKDSSRVRTFIFKEKGESFGCGIVFFDKDNNAGFHMIGTIPDGRGKGIAKSLTERLMIEALTNKCNYCVLNASKMGESIYERLGFAKFGEIENYKILK